MNGEYTPHRHRVKYQFDVFERCTQHQNNMSLFVHTHAQYSSSRVEYEYDIPGKFVFCLWARNIKLISFIPKIGFIVNYILTNHIGGVKTHSPYMRCELIRAFNSCCCFCICSLTKIYARQ